MVVYLLKRGRKVVAFVGCNSEGYYYAFGRPGGNYISFVCKDAETALERAKTCCNYTHIKELSPSI